MVTEFPCNLYESGPNDIPATFSQRFENRRFATFAATR